MAHFAKLGINGKVIGVHAVNNSDILNADGAEDETVGQQFLERIHGWPAPMWIQTSYNTSGGVHRLGGTPLRGNYFYKETTLSKLDFKYHNCTMGSTYTNAQYQNRW